MLGKDYFYNASIRTYVATFGKLFSDIYVKKEKSNTSNLVRIPIHFAQKDKLYTKLFKDNNDTVSLPRLGFSYTIEGVDQDRKTGRGNIQKFKVNGDSESTVNWSYNSVPYNFEFTLTVFTNDIEDGLQIIEQILPNFQPSLTVRIKPLENIDLVVDVPVTLNSVADSYDDSNSIDDRTYYTWDLSFTVKGWLFNHINFDSDGVILDISKVRVFDMLTGELDWSASNE
jgi:hypothetical protein